MHEDESKAEKQRHEDFACTACGGNLKFVPGSTGSIKCQFCGAANELPVMEDFSIEELDFHSYLNKSAASSEMQQIIAVKCSACGAQSTLKPNVTSDNCAFCGTSLVVKNGGACNVLKPKSLLPFKITESNSRELFSAWVNSLWFAPNDLKLYARTFDRLKGMYIPYWTYDSDTYTRYTGQRGIDYQTTESYTDSEGKRQTRTVTRTRWYSVSGSVDHEFDDVLVLASNSLPREKTEKLEPWDLENLVPYQDQYLSGFQTETYQVNLEQGFDRAKQIMDNEIRNLIRRDIGGDRQRIFSSQTKYSEISFKHILLPLWISAYRYQDKVYRFVVNGRTGEVQGERPYSWIKITFFILTILAVIGTAVYFIAKNR